MHKKRNTFHTACKPRDDILQRLAKDAASRQKRGLGGQVLLCVSCDPYQPAERLNCITRNAIKTLHATGHTVCILTKAGELPRRDLELVGPQDAFAISLTARGTGLSDVWEPNAATPISRIRTLEAFYDAGVRTWISFEPVVDPREVYFLARMTSPFTDHYKIGKMNYAGVLPEPLRSQIHRIDWREFAHNVIELMEKLGYERSDVQGANEPGTFYIKQDLAKYLEETK